MAKVSFDKKTENSNFDDVWDIDPTEFNRKKDLVKIIDVRRPDEFTGELGHIPGAQHLVLDQLPQRLEEVPKDQTVVFVCRSGGRSGQAAAIALQNGITDVYNLTGGMLMWNQLGLETEK